MIPLIATVLCFIGICGLFVLDRERTERTSKALWIPVVWLLIAGSRNVGEWLQVSSPMDRTTRYLDGNPIDRAVLGFLMVLGMIVLSARRRQVVRLLRTNMPVLLYFLYCAVSCLWSDYPGVAFKRWVRGMGDLVIVLVILTEPHWLPGLKRVLARVAFLLLPLSVLLIRYYPVLGRGFNNSGSTMFWTGVATDKNGLGMICLIFGLGAAWRFLGIYEGREGDRRAQPLLAQGILVMLMLWLLYESRSMTSIISFALACGLMVAMDRRPWARKPAVASFLGASAVVLSAFVVFGGIGSVLEALGRNPSLTGRTDIWKALLPLAQNPIFGSGYESFWQGGRLQALGDVTADAINEAHNGYLEIYLNLGWVGITLLAFVILTGFRKVIRAVRQGPAVGNLLLAYFIVTLLYNFTEAAFKMMSPVWIFFLLSMMAIQKADVAEAAFSLGTQRDRKFNEFEPQVRPALRFGSRREDMVTPRIEITGSNRRWSK
jgi:exopolysaccharide production protein ExoQ